MKEQTMKKTDLRRQAEAKLSERKKTPAKETDALRLIHELEVHQKKRGLKSAFQFDNVLFRPLTCIRVIAAIILWH